MCAVVFAYACFTWLLVWILYIVVRPSPHISLLGCLYPVPRVIMAMADDGLLSKSLARVNSCTKTPLNATFVASSLAGEILTCVSIKN